MDARAEDDFKDILDKWNISPECSLAKELREFIDEEIFQALCNGGCMS